MRQSRLSLAQVEKRVLASLVDPHTSQTAKHIAQQEHLDVEMFTTANCQELFRSFLIFGANAFEGMIDDEPVADLATAQVDLLTSYIRRIIREYKQHLREIDRTLDEFTTPERDEDDEDCLFKNRWLRRGGCGMVISTSGVGKSSFTMQAATHWGAGIDILGITPMKPLKIGIVQSEDDDYDVTNFRDKIRIGLRSELKWGNEQIGKAERNVTFCAWDGSTGKKFVDYIRRKQLVHHFDLIIVNPLHAFFGGDLKNADEVSRFLRNGIDPILKHEETKCAMIFVHHTGKPSKEKIAEGDFFAGYMGSGSAELINYPRIAITLTPYKEGKVPGVFNLIGSKHGDKLAWRDTDGKLTNKKVVCYANRLERHKNDGCIFWVEPNVDELDDLESAAKELLVKPTVNFNDVATAIANYLIVQYRAGNIIKGVKEHVRKEAKISGYTRSQRAAGYSSLAANPERFGLIEVKDGKSFYYAPMEPKKAEGETNEVEF